MKPITTMNVTIVHSCSQHRNCDYFYRWHPQQPRMHKQIKSNNQPNKQTNKQEQHLQQSSMYMLGLAAICFSCTSLLGAWTEKQSMKAHSK